MSPLPILTSPRGQAALSYLPPLYERSRVMQSLLQAKGTEFDALRAAIDETLNQFFVRTATWSLKDWETELGLSVAMSATDSERRDRIISRIRGYGTCTISVVKQVAEAYDRGTVDVSDDPSSFTLTVTFTDTRGVPPNLDDLKEAMRATVPAHLDIVYVFTYAPWSEWDAANVPWSDVDDMRLTWEQFERVRPAQIIQAATCCTFCEQ